jgi:hypothetical protein
MAANLFPLRSCRSLEMAAHNIGQVILQTFRRKVSPLSSTLKMEEAIYFFETFAEDHSRSFHGHENIISQDK